jgi:hypothetical protein
MTEIEKLKAERDRIQAAYHEGDIVPYRDRLHLEAISAQIDWVEREGQVEKGPAREPGLPERAENGRWRHKWR